MDKCIAQFVVIPVIVWPLVLSVRCILVVASHLSFQWLLSIRELAKHCINNITQTMFIRIFKAFIVLLLLFHCGTLDGRVSGTNSLSVIPFDSMYINIGISPFCRVPFETFLQITQSVSEMNLSTLISPLSRIYRIFRSSSEYSKPSIRSTVVYPLIWPLRTGRTTKISSIKRMTIVRLWWNPRMSS